MGTVMDVLLPSPGGGNGGNNNVGTNVETDNKMKLYPHRETVIEQHQNHRQAGVPEPATPNGYQMATVGDVEMCDSDRGRR